MPAFSVVDALDILLVAYVIYRLMLILRGTRATSIIKGLAVLFVAHAVASLVDLRTITWILKQATTVVLVALPIVFYPELRRALEHLGRGQLFARLSVLGQEDVRRVVDTVVRAARLLSQSSTGALIVFERDVGLEEYIESGIRIEGRISTELLLCLFEPRTSLHDGAVIVRGDRIVAAGSFLPLTEKVQLPTKFGSRHRAALGVSEVSDAVVVVVSEETGTISLASSGKLTHDLDENSLRQELTEALEHNTSILKGWVR